MLYDLFQVYFCQEKRNGFFQRAPQNPGYMGEGLMVLS